MKVITLKQPWATLVAKGYKKYEFRSWKTNYRGKLLIHAGKGIDNEGMKRVKDLNLEYPQSEIIAEVELLDVISLNEEINKKIISENELVYGNKVNREGYAWVIKNPHEISIKDVNGKLGLWSYDI